MLSGSEHRRRQHRLTSGGASSRDECGLTRRGCAGRRRSWQRRACRIGRRWVRYTKRRGQKMFTLTGDVDGRRVTIKRGLSRSSADVRLIIERQNIRARGRGRRATPAVKMVPSPAPARVRRTGGGLSQCRRGALRRRPQGAHPRARRSKEWYPEYSSSDNCPRVGRQVAKVELKKRSAESLAGVTAVHRR